MKIHHLILSMVMGLVVNLFAQTVISDSSFVSGTWTLANSPYIIEGEVIIHQDSLLTMEPGVFIQFQTGTDFDYSDGIVDCGFMRVNGKLMAVGTADNPITFTRNGSEGNWGIIYFANESDDESVLEYCVLEYGNKIDNLHLATYNDFDGVLSLYYASPHIENCQVVNNLSSGIYLYDSSPGIMNNLIADNGNRGINSYASSSEIFNNTIVNNTNYGLYLRFTGWSPTVKNTIFWGNSQSIYRYQGTATISYSSIEEEAIPSNITDGGNNIFGFDPQFFDSESGDYRIGFNSFAAQNGTPDTTGLNLPDYDLMGDERIVSNIVDIGAYESQDADFIRIVSPNGDEAWIGGTIQPIEWESSVANVKLEYSTDGGAIWTNIVGSTPNDGSYSWTVPSVESDNCLIRVTDVVDGSMSDNSDAPFFIYSSTVPDGAQVFGTWTLVNSPYTVEGEVIIPEDSTLTIEPGVTVRFQPGTDFDYSDGVVDCGFMRVNGKLTARGTAASPITFTRNGSEGNWGVLYFADESDDQSRLEYCKVEYGNRIDNLNSATYNDFEGVLSFYYVSPHIENCQVVNNLSSGIYLYQSSPEIINNLIADNGNRGINSYSSNSAIFNNTIVNNTNYGLYLRFTGWSPTIKNTIFWGNSQSIYRYQGAAVMSYSLIEEDTLPSGITDEGNNILGLEPVFDSEGIYPYRIRKTSSCFNAGTPDTLGLSLPEYDVSGFTRVIQDTVDVGAYENNGVYKVETPTFSKTGGIYFGTFRVAINGELGAILHYTRDGSEPTSYDSTYTDSLLIGRTTTLKARGYAVGYDSSNVATVVYELVLGGTEVGGDVGGVWTNGNSPYVVTADVFVPSDSTLTIEPGVEIQFYNDYEFAVSGSLQAGGAEADSIWFTGYEGREYPGAWQGINLNDGCHANLDYVSVRYGKNGIDVMESDVVINHSTIQNNSGAGVKFKGDENSASGQLLNSKVQNNDGWGVRCYAYCEDRYGYANALLEDNKINSNSDGGIYLIAEGGSPWSWEWPGGTIDYARVMPIIRNNEVLNNGGYGLKCEAYGVYTEGYGPAHKSYGVVEPTLFGNIFVNNAQGVYAQGDWDSEYNLRLGRSDVTFDRCTFYGNGNPEITAQDTSTVTVINSILWNTSGTISQSDADSPVIITYSDLDVVTSGDGNINENPSFVAPQNNDFNLNENSPCVDSGDPTSVKDPDSTRADMGALYYHHNFESINYSFELQAWYMLSLPVIPQDSTVATLFPTALNGTAYHWNPSTKAYDAVSKIEPEKGYWIAISEASTSTVSGVPVHSYTKHFSSAGWIMMGSVLNSVSFINPDDTPDGMVLTPAYTWNGSIGNYNSADTLNEKAGYWVAVLGECDLTLDNAGSISKSTTIAKTRQNQFFAQYGSIPPQPPNINWETGEMIQIPDVFALKQNYPNPFNPTTTIGFDLPEDCHVKVVIYNIMGQKMITLSDRTYSAGSYEVLWDGRNDIRQAVSSGIYLCRIQAGRSHALEKLVLVR